MSNTCEMLHRQILSIVSTLEGKTPVFVDDDGNEHENARDISGSSFFSHLTDDFTDHGPIDAPECIDNPESDHDGMYEIDGKFYEEFFEDSDGNILTGGVEKDLHEKSGFDYLSDALDVEYTISRSGEYLGASVLVTFGGPNIWVDTRWNTVKGRWGSDRVDMSFDDEIGLDEACAELFESMRR